MAALVAMLATSAGTPRLRPVRMLGNLFSGLSAPIPDPFDYTALRGLPKSLGKEAGVYALKNQVPEKSKDGLSIATLAGGCFWGTELHLQRIAGVKATCVGYTQGRLEKPTYGEVCSGRTGHTEATMVGYDPKQVSFGALVEALLKTIDPTLKDQVGNDFGTQYRHGVYAHTEAQLEEAKAILAREQSKLPKGRMIHTECKKAAVFWPAEEFHQQVRCMLFERSRSPVLAFSPLFRKLSSV